MNRYTQRLAHSKCFIIISLKGKSQTDSPWEEVGRLGTGSSNLIPAGPVALRKSTGQV